MRLGISTVLPHKTPEEWAGELRGLGMGAAVFPVDHRAPEDVIESYEEAARKYGIVIAEVGSWLCNPASADETVREAAIDYSVGQLQLADRLGASCCVNVAGSAGELWDRPYAENFSQEHWERTVRSIRQIIDRAGPVNTYYTVEPMPWMVPNGPEQYERLLRDVDRERFAVHMDLTNWICTPERYFRNREFAVQCFEILGKYVKSCHIKDALLQQQYTFQIKEVACGQGVLDLETYVRLAEEVNPEMPVLIEHLGSEEEYRESVRYVAERMRKAGISLQ